MTNNDKEGGIGSWHETIGEHRILGGCTPIRDCEPHFHETYIIAFVREGSTITHINGERICLETGMALLVNPYDIIKSESHTGFLYDVCYPDIAFMQAALMCAAGLTGVPKFAGPKIGGELARKIGTVLASIREDSGDHEAGFFEHELLRVIAMHPEIFAAGSDAFSRPECVERACALIERHIEDPISIEEISLQVSRSRFHLARAFRESIGVSPSIYLRQIRLARALERIRAGATLADVATHYGFFDQAHFTREFKRVYGTSPGRLARDVSRCRHTARADLHSDRSMRHC